MSVSAVWTVQPAWAPAQRRPNGLLFGRGSLVGSVAVTCLTGLLSAGLTCPVAAQLRAVPGAPMVRSSPRPGQDLSGEFAPGLFFSNIVLRQVPWSVHVLRVDRTNRNLELHTTHAQGGVGAVSTLSEQAWSLRTAQTEPVAAINGDFYARDGSAYTGDPRGLQIVDGELISAPSGGAAFWIDAQGVPQMGLVTSRFRVSWPDGTLVPFGLNQASAEGAVLYTPAMGGSTFTRNGVELVLERAGLGPWLPLQVGQTYTARVAQVRLNGNTALSKEIMVLSLDWDLADRLPRIGPGSLLTISTTTTPDLRGARTALGGGPILLVKGRLQPLRIPALWGVLSYEYRSMEERHPRSAFGWNERHYFLIQVDGRQPGYSVGMTLKELATFALNRLGCTELINLDGGVSSALWVAGRLRSHPCAGGLERPIANALVVVQRKSVGPEEPTAAGPKH